MVLAPLLLGATCGDPITIPASDSTRPYSELYVKLGDDISPAAGGLVRSVGIQDTVTLFARADDFDGGVKHITIGGGFELTCDIMGHKSVLYGSIDVPETVDLEPGDIGNTGLWVSHVLAHQTDACQGPGTQIVSLHYELYAQSENYHGGISVSAPIVIDVETPGSSPRS